MANRIINSSKLRVGDISISYFIKKATAAENHTIIFIHGFPFNKNSWRPQLSALADYVTGIAIDVRGHGNSTSGHGYFSIDVFAKDLRVFIENLKLKKVILCGVSMGGYISLRTYQLIPDRVSGLILSDTHSKADDNAGKQKRFDSIQAILQFGRRPFAIGFIENLFSKKSIEEQPEIVELIKSSIRRNNVSTICATLLALASRTDTSDSLENIKVPTLVVRGKEDKITPEKLMEEMANAIPGAEFIQFENCGHLPNLEDAVKFNQLLAQFIQKI